MTNASIEEVILACHEYWRKYYLEHKEVPDSLTFGMMDDMHSLAYDRLENFK